MKGLLVRACVFDQNLLEPFELGAIAYGLVLFPQAKDEHRWCRTSAALAADYVAEQHKQWPSVWTKPAVRRPEYLARNNRIALDGLKQRSTKVMEVGGAILTYLQHAVTGLNPLDGGRSSKPSLRQITKIVRSDRPDSACPEATYQDFRKTYHLWQPVAHLAAAYRWQHDRIGSEHFHWDLGNVYFHRQTVLIANAFALALDEMPQVPWRDSDPVRLTWIDYVPVHEITPI